MEEVFYLCLALFVSDFIVFLTNDEDSKTTDKSEDSLYTNNLKRLIMIKW